MTDQTGAGSTVCEPCEFGACAHCRPPCNCDGPAHEPTTEPTGAGVPCCNCAHHREERRSAGNHIALIYCTDCGVYLRREHYSHA